MDTLWTYGLSNGNSRDPTLPALVGHIAGAPRPQHGQRRRKNYTGSDLANCRRESIHTKVQGEELK